MLDNYLLRALLEAEGDNRQDQTDDEEDTNQNADNAEDNQQTAEEQPQEDNEDQNDENEGEDDNEEEDEGDEGGEENPEEEGDVGGEDDFSMDPEGGEDTEDTDTTDDTSSTEPATDETNIQTNILHLSKLDRTLSKRKLFSDFQDLRVSIRTARNLIYDNEENVDPEIREKFYNDIDKLYSTLTDYLSFKFSYINYEENVQNYLLFSKNLQEILDNMNTDEKSKKSRIINIQDEQ